MCVGRRGVKKRVGGGRLMEVSHMNYELAQYANAGRQQALALNNDDIVSANFWTEWAQCVMRTEYAPDRILAEAAYRSAYRAARVPFLATIRMRAAQAAPITLGNRRIA